MSPVAALTAVLLAAPVPEPRPGPAYLPTEVGAVAVYRCVHQPGPANPNEGPPGAGRRPRRPKSP